MSGIVLSPDDPIILKPKRKSCYELGALDVLGIVKRGAERGKGSDADRVKLIKRELEEYLRAFTERYG